MTCPAHDILSQFANATLSDHKAADVVTHLATCETCSRKVAELEHQPKQPILAGLRELQKEQIADEDQPLSRKIAQYDILERIGQGGMGVVYRAVHPHLKREVALKVIHDSRLDDPSTRERFLQEMQALGRLSHPNIVQATDAGVDGDKLFIIMELLDGADLSSYAEQHGPMPVKQAVDCLRQAARGLAFAHAAGYIHRDIKPSNLFLSRDGTLKILDLGLARPVMDASAGSPTRTGHVVGSPDFMAPEQYRGGTVDARSDIYSLGQTFLYMLTGGHDDVSGIPSRLKRVLARMTMGTPSQRYRAAEELLKAINALARTKWRLQMAVLIGTLLFVGIVTVAGLPRKGNKKQTDVAAPVVIKASDVESRLTAAEQTDIDWFLAKHGPGIHAKCSAGWTLLHYAARDSQNVAVAKYLVSQGADVNADGINGLTPLHLAVFENPNTEVAKFIVSQGADVNIKDVNGVTPLHTAASGNQNVEVVKFLLSQGADVNAKNNIGATPLHWAASNENIEVAKYLVSLGADVYAETKDGETPLDLARQARNVALVRYLSGLR